MAIIFLYVINCILFTTEKESAFCAVRTGSSNKLQVDVSLQRVLKGNLILIIIFWNIIPPNLVDNK